MMGYDAKVRGGTDVVIGRESPMRDQSILEGWPYTIFSLNYRRCSVTKTVLARPGG